MVVIIRAETMVVIITLVETITTRTIREIIQGVIGVQCLADLIINVKDSRIKIVEIINSSDREVGTGVGIGAADIGVKHF